MVSFVYVYFIAIWLLRSVTTRKSTFTLCFYIFSSALNSRLFVEDSHSCVCVLHSQCSHERPKYQHFNQVHIWPWSKSHIWSLLDVLLTRIYFHFFVFGRHSSLFEKQLIVLYALTVSVGCSICFWEMPLIRHF